MKLNARMAVSVIFPAILACASLLMAGSLMGEPRSADTPTAQKVTPSAIQIQIVDPGDVPLPLEFRVAVYENVITQIQKTGKFKHVYRSGDKDAASAPDLVTLSMVAQSFNKGSQKKREVTTVSGWSSMTLKVRITDHAGQAVVDRDIEGKVRFFGENLNVTYDFSKKVAGVVRDTF